MNPVRIVLIEDNPGDVFLVKMALTDSGIDYRLWEFRCGIDAVRELCKRDGEDSLIPDAILMDLNTPRTDGFQTLQQLKQTARLSNVPIAILTSSQAHTDKQRAAQYGVTYIEKPSGLKEFLSVVGDTVKKMLAAREAGCGASSSGQ
jgi:CheY-like chemotaxis protein